MGYDIHITRKENWWEEDNLNYITLAEWLAYISQDSEMRPDNFVEAKLPDGITLTAEDDGIAVWSDYSLNGKEGNFAWFSYNNGEVVVKNTDEEILKKMVEVAKYFNAK